MQQRDIHFDLSGCKLDRWHPAGLHVSHFFNAMSVFFPEGEKFFIESVRHYRDRITDARLQQDVQGFIGQEAMHGREHRAYNEALARAGYPIERLEKGVIRLLNFTRWISPPAHHLAVTIALEHFTAILANLVLEDPRVLARADPKMAALWRWHAIEETEHKAVAYDVYTQATGNRLRGYVRRCVVMLFVSVQFWWMVWRYHWQFVKQDQALSDWSGWRALWRFQWVSPGTLRRIILPWLAYFRPGFHPWQHDNRRWVEQWKQHYAASELPPS